MEEVVAIIGGMTLGAAFLIGLPWLILHYITKWKSAQTLPVEDENLLDELYDLARRLEDRVHTVERIIAADNPDWRPMLADRRGSEALPGPDQADRYGHRGPPEDFDDELNRIAARRARERSR